MIPFPTVTHHSKTNPMDWFSMFLSTMQPSGDTLPHLPPALDQEYTLPRAGMPYQPDPDPEMSIVQNEDTQVTGGKVTQPTPTQTPVGPVRPTQWDALINEKAAKYGLSPDLLKRQMLAESGGNPRAVSSAGAMGLMQLMPRTARGLGVTDPFDPGQSVEGGAKYLAQMMRMFGDTTLALAAYNAGPGNVKKYGGVPPFRETQGYIQRIQGRG